MFKVEKISWNIVFKLLYMSWNFVAWMETVSWCCSNASLIRFSLELVSFKFSNTVSSALAIPFVVDGVEVGSHNFKQLKENIRNHPT